jgi:hypothetical protein
MPLPGQGFYLRYNLKALDDLTQDNLKTIKHIVIIPCCEIAFTFDGPLINASLPQR